MNLVVLLASLLYVAANFYVNAAKGENGFGGKYGAMNLRSRLLQQHHQQPSAKTTPRTTNKVVFVSPQSVTQIDKAATPPAVLGNENISHLSLRLSLWHSTVYQVPNQVLSAEEIVSREQNINDAMLISIMQFLCERDDIRMVASTTPLKDYVMASCLVAQPQFSRYWLPAKGPAILQAPPNVHKSINIHTSMATNSSGGIDSWTISYRILSFGSDFRNSAMPSELQTIQYVLQYSLDEYMRHGKFDLILNSALEDHNNMMLSACPVGTEVAAFSSFANLATATNSSNAPAAAEQTTEKKMSNALSGQRKVQPAKVAGIVIFVCFILSILFLKYMIERRRKRKLIVAQLIETMQNRGGDASKSVDDNGNLICFSTKHNEGALLFKSPMLSTPVMSFRAAPSFSEVSRLSLCTQLERLSVVVGKQTNAEGIAKDQTKESEKNSQIYQNRERDFLLDGDDCISDLCSDSETVDDYLISRTHAPGHFSSIFRSLSNAGSFTKVLASTIGGVNQVAPEVNIDVSKSESILGKDYGGVTLPRMQEKQQERQHIILDDKGSFKNTFSLVDGGKTNDIDNDEGPSAESAPLLLLKSAPSNDAAAAAVAARHDDASTTDCSSLALSGEDEKRNHPQQQGTASCRSTTFISKPIIVGSDEPENMISSTVNKPFVEDDDFQDSVQGEPC